MSQIKLIAMDMDGTLLDDQQRIPEENRSALLEASRHGVHIALCSGRSARDVSYFASDAGLDECHVISLNGACCLDAPHRKPYRLQTLNSSAVTRITDILTGRRVTFACFQYDRVIVIKSDYDVDPLNWGLHTAREQSDVFTYGLEALTRYRNEGVCKIVYIDKEDSPRIEEIRREISPIPGLMVTASWTNNLELMPLGVSKGVALRELASRLSILPEEVMALGDYDNDLNMIEYAGLGVAMGNASESVKKAARYVTLSNVENGVAAAIRKFVL